MMISTWTKTDAGYATQTECGQPVVLARVVTGRKKVWTLTVGETVITLGKKASFDHAEAAILALG